MSFVFQNEVNKMRIFFTIILLFSSIQTAAFPGDHNSVTCRETVSRTDLRLKFIKKKSDGTNVTETELRDGSIEKVIDNASLQSKHRKDKFFTMWGDSLTDLVRVYGFIEPQFFGYGPPSGGQCCQVKKKKINHKEH